MPGVQASLLEAASSALHTWFVTSLCRSTSSILLDLICKDLTVGQRMSMGVSSHLSPWLRQAVFVGFWLCTAGPRVSGDSSVATVYVSVAKIKHFQIKLGGSCTHL